ncbi:MAG: flagellar motor switch protein FliG [Deltaproteobacteria bacterium]|nr:MAG: flagellar motor switch protein FliG [Deltaproteobacteria bacterium]
MHVHAKKVDGLKKVAAFLTLVGEEAAAEIFAHLEPEEISLLATAIEGVKLTPQEAFEVLREFMEKSEQTLFAVDGSYIEKVAAKALGEEKAKELVGKVEREKSVFDLLKEMDAQAIYNMISREHPQVIAIVLIHLEPSRAAEVLSRLPDELKFDVSMRMANITEISPSMLRELEEVLKTQIKNYTPGAKVEGVKRVAEILNYVDREAEEGLLGKIQEENEELAETIKKLMFTFNDLIQIDDKGIQAVLKEVTTDDLSLALKMADEELKEKIFRNMSQRAVQILKEEMETRGAVRLSEVEAAQMRIIEVAKRLEAEGKIVIGGKGGEELIY